MGEHEIDFGKAASDYALHRQGFPPEFLLKIFKEGYITSGQFCLDIGTGTGTLARGLALHKCNTTGLDISPEMVAKAKSLDAQFGVQVQYKVGTAEGLPFEDKYFDVVLSGQCWHWFDTQKAFQEVKRVLKPWRAFHHLLFRLAAFIWNPSSIERASYERDKPKLEKMGGKWILFAVGSTVAKFICTTG
jgi:SAM-dependent methyltransferase